MRKTFIALVAAATVLATTFASSNKAEAWWGWWPGAVIGGVVAGAIVGSAIAPRPYYPYGYLVRTTALTHMGSLPKGMERICLGTRLLGRSAPDAVCAF